MKGQKIYKCNLAVKKIGDSFYAHLDKNVKGILDIQDGMILNAKLMNIELTDVVCPKCEFKFIDYDDEDPHDCPNCGEEFLDIDKKEFIEEPELDNIPEEPETHNVENGLSGNIELKGGQEESVTEY